MIEHVFLVRMADCYHESFTVCSLVSTCCRHWQSRRTGVSQRRVSRVIHVVMYYIAIRDILIFSCTFCSHLRCHLLLADVQADHLIAVVSSCREATSSNISIQTSLCNVVDKSQVQNSMFAADNIAHGVSGSKASILVNCAGITRDAKISNISDTDWEEVLGVNLKGTFNMCQAFCETDRAVSLLTSGNNGGSIINIGSIVSTYGNVGQCNYAASKGGVVGLTRALAKEMALLSFKVAQSKEHMQMSAIRVNCIQPG